VNTIARFGLLLCVAAAAVPAATNADEKAAVLSREELASRYLGLKPEDVRDSPIPGMYEVARGASFSYVTTDGRYMIRGDVIDLQAQTNVTEQHRAEIRASLFASIDPATEIVFSPADGNVKHRVVVFTDVDCGYCREFHRGIAEVNALGIEVRYVSYPRTGPNTESWSKAEGVWCAADRKTALTRAKLGAEVPAVPGCASAPIAAEYELGRQVGLAGTPGVYSDSGVELGGYLPPKELLEALEKIAAAK
jgi:thiol:disulfide interchange protein DsbC